MEHTHRAEHVRRTRGAVLGCVSTGSVLSPGMPALFTRTSRSPTVCAAARTEAPSVTSNCTNRALQLVGGPLTAFGYREPDPDR